MQADIGLIGLAVMGQNLVLNMSDHGYTVAVFNRTVEKVDRFVEGPAKGHDTILPTRSVAEFVAALKRPRRIMLMVKAGAVVDSFIDMLLPHLQTGDIIIDGGNSHYPDSTRRTRDLAEKGILFIGTGVSGGEEGARRGPSIMPGGNPEAWPAVKPIFQGIAAKTPDGTPCCDWVGKDGAGHYVKMVHNGIEYGDMQLISEAYFLMKHVLGLSNQEMHKIFDDWNTTELDSFLVEITRDILGYKEPDGTYLLDKIMDAAGQKGTGKWTGINALDAGIPVTLIIEAVLARSLSALKDERVQASKLLQGPEHRFDGDTTGFVEDIRKALLASKIVSYAQGYMLIRQASEENNWDIDYGAVAMMWREGCIIRSAFLGNIKEAYDRNPQLPNLLQDEYFRELIHSSQDGWRRVVAQAALSGVPVPTMATALSFYDGYRSERLSANMIQAQRDYFGAHTYERTDKPRGEFFHTNWTGSGGDVAAGSYNV
ncbi:decarboxylating NADP(+)-dependent phosphogluconate dehydrogenase [Spirochaeta africana]|uniref:6-phosphogluconate dehydrogenase, decarboxylating n=1 Tax=Spirochaeta africana (strain ATCC 700263 / DSM 8902 / Z-7692) TaxID=889378 RepID=H9UIK0_SPIAZ|nr:decarboxylating NADP(+)-dependent phosphogluconate dehydrogenase [Spirochaeta africana]AFG37343.1 6-phosphogluconate dehydrogenase, decarboxylating [Spirochaeta africana DSM 8902]